MKDERSSAIPRSAFAATIVSMVLMVSCAGSLLSAIVDAQVPEVRASDLAEEYEGGSALFREYVASLDVFFPGTINVKADMEGAERIWISIEQGGVKLLRGRNVSLPLEGSYQMRSTSDVLITVRTYGGISIEDLELTASVIGPVGILGTVTGIVLCLPCSISWMASLALVLVGLWSVSREKGSRKAGKGGVQWS